jgi:hypothetical protein
MNMSAPFGNSNGDPGLYGEVTNNFCCVASLRWSAGGFGGLCATVFKVGVGLEDGPSSRNDAVHEHGREKMELAMRM